jgi:hypothetical protein
MMPGNTFAYILEVPMKTGKEKKKFKIKSFQKLMEKRLTKAEIDEIDRQVELEVRALLLRGTKPVHTQAPTDTSYLCEMHQRPPQNPSLPIFCTIH